jgi:hypothetical protein
MNILLKADLIESVNSTHAPKVFKFLAAWGKKEKIILKMQLLSPQKRG